jgi:hypothetical protein
VSDIRAITIWQPWATLIAEGCKPFEFRGWPAPKSLVGQRIAIHAGARKAPKDEVRDLLLRLHSSSWRETGLLREPSLAILEKALPALGSLPLSSVLCTAVLGQPIRGAVLAGRLGLPAVNDSDRDAHLNWGWPLTDIEKVQPFAPAKGSQGFWIWHGP